MTSFMAINRATSSFLSSSVFILEPDEHALALAVGRVGLAAQVLAQARALVAARGQDVIARAAVAVDPDGPRLDAAREPDRARDVRRVETRGEAVGRMVGERDRFLLGR